MVRKILYEIAEENQIVDEEEKHFSEVVELMALQKTMTKERDDEE